MLLSPPGGGKSDFLLRLLRYDFVLVADDQVLIDDNIARAPPCLAGLLEVCGLGIFHVDHAPSAVLRLAIQLIRPATRLPEPAWHDGTGLPLVHIDPACPSGPDRAVLALEAACGRIRQHTGAFTA
ncbi:MAG: aldolase [Acidocella sp.]|nr:aldolase [Acidocella sp.]